MNARLPALLVLLGPAAMLGAALLFQHVGGLQPCEMCIWQRWPHGVAIGVAALALLLGRGRAGGALLGLAALIVLAGAGIGAFHAGVEYGWWEGPTACTGAPMTELSAADFVARLKAAPLVRCDEPAWSLFGVSMAGWNAILSMALALLIAAGARRYASSSASQ